MQSGIYAEIPDNFDLYESPDAYDRPPIRLPPTHPRDRPPSRVPPDPPPSYNDTLRRGPNDPSLYVIQERANATNEDMTTDLSSPVSEENTSHEAANGASIEVVDEDESDEYVEVGNTEQSSDVYEVRHNVIFTLMDKNQSDESH